MRTNNQYEYDLITENDREIQEPEETKEYIAEYCENLYQAREGKDKYKEWTKSIQTKTNELKHKQTGPRKPITLEVKKAAKQLKRNKALGPDELPNELFIEANNYTIQLLTDLLNIVHMRKNIPDEWRKGIITRLYKGKGKKGKCSNGSGITVSSNIGKVYERIIDNRSRPQIKISEAQVGGREGRSTTDHLTILKESIATQKKRKQPLYMVYLDVTKTYDKAWLDALLYVLNKRGIETENWQIMAHKIVKLDITSIDEIYTRNVTKKVKHIISMHVHPLKCFYDFMRSGTRLRAISCRTQRYRKSFVPNSIHVYNMSV